MKAKITEVRAALGQHETGIAVEFEVRKMPHMVLVYPGQDLKARMRQMVAEMRIIRQGKKESKKLLSELKPLEGQTVEL